MDGEVDEFEKYFKKASDQMMELRCNEELSGKKSKEKRGSSYKNSLPPHHQDECFPSRQARKSICNPLTDAAAAFSLLKPQINVVDASSAPSSRSGSFKLSKTSSARNIQDEFLSVGESRGRRSSLTPEELAENKLKEIKDLENDDFFVVRSFLTSPQGLVNRGDSFKRKSVSSSEKGPAASQQPRKSSGDTRRHSEIFRSHRPSVHSTTSASISDVITANSMAASNADDPISLQPEAAPSKDQKYQHFAGRPSIEITRCYFPDEVHQREAEEEQSVKSRKPPPFKRILSHELPHNVIVLGDHRVGKTSLVTQFLTSEHLAGLDTSHDSMESDRTVSVSVDGVETMLNFIDADIKDYDELQASPYTQGSAYLVVYSITDASSFYSACSLARQLCQADITGKKEDQRRGRPYAVIVVANKGDLVRKRKILDLEARDECEKMGCKYIEISAGLNHKVDELLVGVVCQVRLNDTRKELLSKSSQSRAGRKSSAESSPGYMGWFKKLFGLKNKAKDERCDDMQTL